MQINHGTERRHGSRTLSVICVLIGLSAMCCSMWMNARFGWGQASAIEDRYFMSMLHTLIDPAAAVLVAIGGVLIGRGRYWQGALALACAALFVAWSMISVYGFMSTRIAANKGHESSVKVTEKYLSWVQNQTVNSDIPRTERHLMGDEVRDTIKKLKAEVSVVPDAQAASIADMFGTTTERVQRTLVVVSSGIAQAIKFACLFFGFLIWPHKLTNNNREISGSSESSSSGGSSSENSGSSGERTSEQEAKENVVKFPPVSPGAVAANFTANQKSPLVRTQPFRSDNDGSPITNFKRTRSELLLDDLQRLIRERGCIPNQRQLCKRWDMCKSRVSELLSDWEDDGHIVRRKKGNQKSIELRRFDARHIHAPGTA
jgi:hypothetical protein